MRRAEFEIKDKAALEGLLSECEYGTLALLDGDAPYCIPLNFVWFEDSICFHGSHEGRKVQLIAKNQKASFSAVKPYSLIPSYFSGTISACPATHYFASAYIEGEISKIENDTEKCAVLNALMQKLQPEGGYETIEATNPIYTKMISQTAVFRLKAAKTSLKAKLGQNLTPQNMQNIIEQLANRGSQTDTETIEAIKRIGQK